MKSSPAAHTEGGRPSSSIAIALLTSYFVFRISYFSRAYAPAYWLPPLRALLLDLLARGFFMFSRKCELSCKRRSRAQCIQIKPQPL